MLQHHVNLKDAVSRPDDVNLDNVLIASSTERRIVTLVQNLAELYEVFFKLQSNNCTLRQARAYLNCVLNVYPTLEARHIQDARIVHNAIFGNAVLNI